MSFNPVNEMRSSFKSRCLCESCARRRVCEICASCQEPICRECEGTRTKDTDERICQDCLDEAREYAQWGVWGPP